MTLQEVEFLKNRGEKQWLQGIQFLPTKMRNLLFLNKVLAHQPWYVQAKHLKVSPRKTLHSVIKGVVDMLGLILHIM